MTEAAGCERAGSTERFVYFVVRIRFDPQDPAAGPTGIIERLGSGRARRFSGTQDLLAVLAEEVGVPTSPPPASGAEPGCATTHPGHDFNQGVG